MLISEAIFFVMYKHGTCLIFLNGVIFLGRSILNGITTGLLITVLALVAMFLAAKMGFEQKFVSYVLDFGLLLSCLSAGYKAGRDSGMIIPSVAAACCYALIGIILLALFFPINPIGAIKIIGECIGLGFVSGIAGAEIMKRDAGTTIITKNIYKG